MQHVIQNKTLKVTVNLSGAEVCSVKDSNGTEYLWQGDPSVWARHAPVLFPVVGKLHQNCFLYRNREYHLPQHGFARDKIFEVEKVDETACTFRLESDVETLEKFPFPFSLLIRYQLIGGILTTSFEVMNHSAEEMYFSLGAHPGFNCPLLPDETMEDYYLEFEKNELKVSLLEDGLLSGNYRFIELDDKKLPLSKDLFNSDALVLEGNQVNKVRLVSLKSGPVLDMYCDNWPYFGVWSKKGCDRFICLEPWYGIADVEGYRGEISNKKGIRVLKPHASFKCAFSLHFH